MSDYTISIPDSLYQKAQEIAKQKSCHVKFVHERAAFQCEYCQTGQRVTGQAMHVEHIKPGGGDNLENLALACATCNLSKARATSTLDLIVVILFHYSIPAPKYGLRILSG